MTIKTLSNVWDSISFPALNSYLQEMPQNALFSGLAGSSDAFLISNLFSSSSQSVFVLVENSKKAETLVEECRSFIGNDSVLLFPSRDAIPYNMKSPFGPTIESRLRVLSELLSNTPKVFIAPCSTLLQKIPTRKSLFNKVIRLHPGDEIKISVLSSWLSEIGFHRENQVTDLGTYSIRGGIVDIYPFLGENPFRIEFWGDNIDSIREFDVFTQKSLDSRSSIEIFPMKEFCFSDSQIESALESMKEFCRNNDIDEMVVHKLEHQWKTVGDFEGIEWFFHWFSISTSSILDFLPTNTLLVWDDFVPVNRRLDETLQNYGRHLERVPELFRPLVSNPEQLLFSQRSVEDDFSMFNCIYIDTLDIPQNTSHYKVSFIEQPQLPKELDLLTEDLSKNYQQGLECFIVSQNLGHAERMQELIGEKCPFVQICTGYISRGFIDRQNQILLYTESQIFNRTARPVHVKKHKSGIPITGFDALSPQDYVVHEDHGIAKFIGIERVKTGDTQNDCMVLIYADNAKVYVPVDDFHKVQKYVGKDTVVPSLSKIGTSAWEKLKTKTKESLKEMAQELIELYAKRQFLEGIRFQPDNLWQKEFEDSFIYDETPDQLRAIKEVKEDMESSKPMDRLICGDVGFGKTEIAMRAAFKAVMSGYQVAVLAPTTILAAQHYATFSERMADFPVKIAMLSRFLKPSEQKPILDKIKTGGVEILIGTHRILSEDIEFKNLGLLIIDEEQRFGVNHKEKLKQLRYKVDTLSMTATPIPRTLHMSLIGARDLSIINTPPRNRLPIETKVAEYHDELVKSAIDNELERGGQVFFVNNRIKNLELIQDKIEQLVPKARVISAHGQMDEKLLEMIMKEFIAGRYDVLLSTVIIENGLDISNVNTIIVNRADSLGLSQLYQLRGRVGRSSEQAYAYFLTPPFKQVNEISLKRLRALEQYTDLGSGFQIAMRDMEIRGAGNILGTRQHGFIAAVGFELYCRLLQDAVKEINGETPVKEVSDVKVELPLQAYIPTEYISDGPTRIAVYQELSSVSTLQNIDELQVSISDRFGPIPEPVNSLLLLMKTKILASNIGCSRVVISKNSDLILYFDTAEDQIKNIIEHIFKSSNSEFEIQYEKPISLKTRLVASTNKEIVLESLNLLSKINIH
ncbi:MAG: transcription-repair coupling factor [Fibrobacter sp.]|nr:transcription-repair coupling factor [Fibrobacter sp.]